MIILEIGVIKNLIFHPYTQMLNHGPDMCLDKKSCLYQTPHAGRFQEASRSVPGKALSAYKTLHPRLEGSLQVELQALLFRLKGRNFRRVSRRAPERDILSLKGEIPEEFPEGLEGGFLF